MKTAVFYDVENLCLTAKNGDFIESITSIQQKVGESELTGDIILQRAYIGKTHSAFERIEADLKTCGIETVIVEPVIQVARKKTNMVDFKMSVDAIATIAAKRSIMTVAMASGDSDFGFTCQQIKKMGKKLLVISRFSATSGALLKICDDWVDLNAQSLTPKFIRKAIEVRVAVEKTESGFTGDFAGFLNALEADCLIRRYMSTFGLPFPIFTTIIQEKVAGFPKYSELGILRLTDFMEILLSGTPFQCRNGIVYYRAGRKRQPSQRQLIESILRLPQSYTREKLLSYYDIAAELENIEELLVYFEFMRRVGMISGNKLCQRRTFRASIRKYIRAVAKKAGLVLDEAALADVNERL
ncbi:MAG: NYN domain-containing protein [Oscillospiraceae bacterium]|nr:NYN domain-containing protein [Oscillospiraceae bacterium]